MTIAVPALNLRLGLQGQGEVAQGLDQTATRARETMGRVQAANAKAAAASNVLQQSVSKTAVVSRQTSQAITGLAASTTKAGAAAKGATKDVDGFSRSTKKAGDEVGAVSKKIESLKDSFWKMKVAVAAVATGLIAQSFLQAGSQIEVLTVQFKTLLGTEELAKERIQELANFAKVTPFELGEVAEADRVLQVFTGNALATGKSLQMIGDAAAGTSTPFKDVAFWVGRLYSALDGGAPIGEEVMRLNELAIISSQARQELLKLSHSHAPLAQSMKVVEAELGRFNGAMGDLSGTVSGRYSTSVDLVKQGMRSILAGGGWSAISNGIEGFNIRLGQLIDSGALETIGASLRMVAIGGTAMLAAMAPYKIAAIITQIRGLGVAMTALSAANPILLGLSVTAGVGVVAYGALKQAAVDSMTGSRKEIQSTQAQLQAAAAAVDPLAQKFSKLSAQMKQGAFGTVAPILQPAAASAPKPKSLTEDQAKEVEKLTKEVSSARIQANYEGLERERQMEIAEHSRRIKDFGDFTQAIELENSRHRLALQVIDAESAKEAAKASVEATQKVMETQKVERAKAKEADLQAREADVQLDSMMQTLRIDAIKDAHLREQAEAASHYGALTRQVEKYTLDSAKSQETLTLISRAGAEKRKAIEKAEWQSRASVVGASATNIIKAWGMMYSESKKNALLHKTLAIAEIAINTALAVTQTIAKGGFWSIPLAVTVGALGAAQAFKVSQQKFAQGGMVQGNAYYGDQVPAWLNPGEVVLNQKQQGNLLLSMANGRSWSPQQRATQNSFEVTWSPQINFSGDGGARKSVVDALRDERVAFGELMTETIRKGYA